MTNDLVMNPHWIKTLILIIKLIIVKQTVSLRMEEKDKFPKRIINYKLRGCKF